MAEVTPGAVAPEVPVAPAVETAPTPDSTAEQPVVETQPEEKPERTFTQKELDDIVQRRLAKESRRAERLGEERARREVAERELERIRNERTQPAAQGEPQPDNFKDWDSYQRALIDYRVEQKIAAQQEQSQRKSASQQEERGLTEYAQKVQTATKAAAEKYEDFGEVIASGVFTAPMTAFIAEVAKDGGELAYYLGNNRTEAQRIAGLSAPKQIVEMQLLESKLAAPPKPTSTPPPIVPNGTKTTVEKDPSQMTDKEYNDWRRRQIAQRR